MLPKKNLASTKQLLLNLKVGLGIAEKCKQGGDQKVEIGP